MLKGSDFARLCTGSSCRCSGAPLHYAQPDSTGMFCPLTNTFRPLVRPHCSCLRTFLPLLLPATGEVLRPSSPHCLLEMSYSLHFIKNLEQSIWAAQEKEDSMFPVGKHKCRQTYLCWLWLGLEQLHLAQAGRAQRGGLPARL